MLVVTNVDHSTFWSCGESVKPLSYTGDIVVAIDPSKTNMAVWIFSYYGEPLHLVEFSGNERGQGHPMDTTQYLLEVREYLTKLFVNSKIAYGGIEAAITKKGWEHHYSGLVLNEIRGTMLNFFLEKYGIYLMEVNNWAWKAAVLPDGYRSRNEKGSKRWICDYFPGNMLTRCFNADATDAYCIGIFLMNHLPKKTIMCDRKVECNKAYKFFFYEPIMFDYLKATEFTYSFNYSLKENLDFYANLQNIPGKAMMPVAAITLQDINRNTVFSTVPEQDKIAVLVQPCESS